MNLLVEENWTAPHRYKALSDFYQEFDSGIFTKPMEAGQENLMIKLKAQEFLTQFENFSKDIEISQKLQQVQEQFIYVSSIIMENNDIVGQAVKDKYQEIETMILTFGKEEVVKLSMEDWVNIRDKLTQIDNA